MIGHKCEHHILGNATLLTNKNLIWLSNEQHLVAVDGQLQGKPFWIYPLPLLLLVAIKKSSQRQKTIKKWHIH